jgi:hypothetical protein
MREPTQAICVARVIMSESVALDEKNRNALVKMLPIYIKRAYTKSIRKLLAKQSKYKSLVCTLFKKQIEIKQLIKIDNVGTKTASLNISFAKLLLCRFENARQKPFVLVDQAQMVLQNLPVTGKIKYKDLRFIRRLLKRLFGETLKMSQLLKAVHSSV